MDYHWRKPQPKKSNRKRIYILTGITLAVLIGFIITVTVLLSGRNAKNENDAISGNSKIDREEQPPSVTDAAKENDPGDNITAVAAEAAPVDDKEDPQAEGSAGIKVNIGDMADNGVQIDNEGEKNNSSDEEDTITYGIDVAKWQGVIDWKKVKASEVDFAMIRVGYRTQVTGVIVEDPYAKYNLQKAQANGIKIGIYFFSTAVNVQEAKEEATWVSEFIAPYPVTYPVVFNCEGFSDTGNRQYGLGISERSKIAAAFLDDIKDKGYRPMFYAARNELVNNAEWDASYFNGYKLWIAQYPDTQYTDAAKSTYQGKYDMWQYTNIGQVPGIDKPVDINIAYFGYKKTAKPKTNTPQEEATADPAALINFTTVNETVTAKLETNLRSVPSSQGTDTIVTTIKHGDTATRTGIGDNGWSRLEYKGRILYAVSSYLTTDLTAKITDLPPEPTAVPEKQGPYFQEVKEQVTAKSETNLRSEPSTSNPDTILAVLKNGDAVTRTGISDNGWSRIDYQGQTLYAVSSYLTTDLNYTDNHTPTVDNPEAGIIFTEVNEKVTAKEKTNLRTVPNSESSDTITEVLMNGDVAVRTGIGNNGWSRVEYNGQTLYAISSYLILAESN